MFKVVELLLPLLSLATASPLVIPRQFNQNNLTSLQCPDYAIYSNETHAPFSNGSVGGLPYMRPNSTCRTFYSSAVEDTIQSLLPRFKDPDLGRLFENAFPNTLDTTIKWEGDDLAFIVTGDIDAEWFRDSYNQLKAYIDLIPYDRALANLTRKTIALQARFLSEFPYCNSFQPPRESGLMPEEVADSDCLYTEPACSNQTVFTCNFEIDSYGAFMGLAADYYEKTSDASLFQQTGNGSFVHAFEGIIGVMETEQLSTFANPGGWIRSGYNFTRDGNKVDNNGVGPPQRYTGMIGTSFRPSDDHVTYHFHIPNNAMLSVQLKRAAPLLAMTRSDLAKRAQQLSSTIKNGIEEYGIFNHPKYGKVYAYETDGYYSYNIMDDANVPSLLSLPYLGYCDVEDEVYAQTRKMVLSVDGNPYYNKGPAGGAIGSPHTWIQHVWPMSLISQIQTSNDDDEIQTALQTILNTTSGLGLIHESFWNQNSTTFTRQWFAWANSYFGETILKLAKERPSLILHDS